MFTGIVEEIGQVTNLEWIKGNLALDIQCSFIEELKVDQSIAHNGVCLTVVSMDEHSFRVEAIAETLRKSNLSDLRIGTLINLERCLKLGDRLDGHLVQGHVDTTGRCSEIKSEDGSWIFKFEIDKEFNTLLVSKGSVCVNGVSLTVADAGETDFSVAIIPYTYEHTNFNKLMVEDKVNIEFDIIGKYMQKHISAYKN